MSFDPISHIERTFAEQAERVFLIEYPLSRQLTYAEFRAAALRAAAMLRAHGVGRGDRVAMVLANSAEFAALYFACMFLGAIAVPVNQALHPREVHSILARAGARLLLFSQCTRPLVLSATAGLPLRKVRVQLGQEQAFHPDDDTAVWSFDAPPAGALPTPFAGVEPQDLFVVLFTSGTTSTPKGVAHRLFAEVANAHAFNCEMGFTRANRFLHIWPMAYSTGLLNTLLSPFVAGGSVVLAPAFGPQTVLTFWKPVLEYHVDTLWLSPTMLASLLRVDRDKAGIDYCGTSVRTICVGTAPLPLRLKKDFEAKYGVELFESYGLSELLIITTNSRRHSRRDGSVGRLLEGVDLAITDDQGQRLDPTQDGEIQVRTPFAMAGYLDEQTGQPAWLATESFFPTGDLGHLDGEGNLLVTGRKKDLIIRGGLNISPRAIRDVLLEHPAVDDAAVVGLPHDFYGEEIVAAVRLRPGANLGELRPAILKLCRERLNQASVPSRVVGFKEFPTGPTGKVLSRELRDRIARLPSGADEA